MKNKDRTQKVDQRDKIKQDFSIKTFEWTEKQKQFIELALNKESKIIFLNGPAGSSKTLLSCFIALKLLKDKKVSDLIYIRSVIESASRSLGYLKGEIDQKFEPYLMPLHDKLNELLYRADIDKLFNDNRIIASPINFIRGANYNAKIILVEEAQNFEFRELVTAMTRIGKFSKMIILGDSMQSDINSKSGFKKMFDLFNDKESQNNGIFCFEFTKDDIMRAEFLKFVLERIEKFSNIRPAQH